MYYRILHSGMQHDNFFNKKIFFPFLSRFLEASLRFDTISKHSQDYFISIRFPVTI